MAKNLFIIGTGTDVGKTYVAGLIVKKLHEAGAKAAYYKAAVSGNARDATGELIPGDASFVKGLSGIEQPLSSMCPYVYEAAVSPHLASRMEGNPVKLERVMEGYEAVAAQYDYVTLEGSGGVLCPLDFDDKELYLPDFIKAGDFACLLVADAGLGTINDVGLTAYYLRREGITLKGIIFNHFHPGDVMEEDNLRMCEHLTGVKVVACVGDGDEELALPAEELIKLYE